MASNTHGVHRPAKPNVLDLRAAQISNAYNEVLDINDLIMEFSVTEDIFNEYITGYIVVNDGLGLIERFPLLGEEILYFEYSSPGIGDTPYHKRNFRVMEVGERIREKVDLEVYTIHFISIEYFIDMTTTVNKSYISESPSNIVRKVYKNYLADPRGGMLSTNTEEKTLHVCHGFDIYEPTTPLTIQAPKDSPFEIITHVCEEAGMTEMGSPDEDFETPEVWGDFVFFERHDGFHFTSMSLLQKGYGGFGESYFHGFQNIDCDDLYKDVVEQPTASGGGQGTSSQRRLTEITLAEKVKQRHTFNVVRDHAEGMYDNTVAYIDPLIKKYEKKTFVYNKDFKQIAGTGSFAGSHRVTSETDDSHYNNLTGNSLTEYIATNIVPNKELPNSEKVGAEHLKYGMIPYLEKRINKDGIVYDHRSTVPRTKHKWLNHKIASWASLDHTVIDITVNGDTRATIGTLIEWYTPIISDMEEHLRKTSPTFGGANGSYFLITAVEQRYNKMSDAHFTLIQMVKSNYARNLEKVNQIYGIVSHEADDE